MRKKILESPGSSPADAGQGWLDLDPIATVEVASEDPQFPIESALASDGGPGWRASQPGEQKIRIVFDKPTPLHRIHLRFQETEHERTQEFTLRWWPASGEGPREIVRQQWNFSPSGTTTEAEDFKVDLGAVSTLELSIRPDIGRRDAIASLASWRVS